MTDEALDVRFGATTSEIESGADRVREKLEKVKESADKITESGKHILEIFGIAFTADKIAEFIAAMGEAGERTERFAQTLGLTTQQVGEYEFIAKATGSTLEGMSLSLERMTLSIQRSTSSGTSPAAIALDKLGLSAKTLSALPLDKQFDKIVEAASRFNTDIQLTNALTAIGGRSMANLIPIIAQGAEGLAKLRQAAKDAGAGMSPGMASAFAETNLKLLSMHTALGTLGERIFSVIKPGVDIVIDALTKFFRTLDTDKIRQFLKDGVDALANGVIVLITSFYTLGDTVDEVLNKILRILKGAALGGALGILGGPVGVVGGALIGAGTVAAWDDFIAGFKKGSDKAQDDIDSQKAKIVAKVNALRDAVKGALKDVNAEGGEHHGPPKPSIGPTEFGDNAKIQSGAIDAEIRVMQAGLARKLQVWQTEADLYQITQRQKVSMSAAAVNEEYENEKAKLNEQLRIYAKMPAERQGVLNKLSDLEQKNATDIARINADSIKQQMQDWNQLFGQLQSSFNGQLRGLLSGTVSFGQAMKTIFGDLIIYVIQQIEKMVFNWIAGQLAIKTAQVATAASGAATAEAGVTAQLPIAVQKIQQSVAEVFAGAAAFFAPTLGPGAPAAALGVASAVEAAAMAGLAVGSAETGAWDTAAGMWQLHDKEMVLPAPAAQTFRDMAEGGGMGGSQLHIHATLADGPSLARFFKQNAGLQRQFMSTESALNPA